MASFRAASIAMGRNTADIAANVTMTKSHTIQRGKGVGNGPGNGRASRS